MITDMAEKTEPSTKERFKNIEVILNWLSSRFGKMADTLYDLHKENLKFQAEFDRKQEIIERQLYELRGRDYKAYRT